MRIAMLADVYKPHISGVTNYISLNKKILEDEGHEVYVFTFGDQEYQDDEPNVIRSPGFPFLEAAYYVGFRYTRQARKVLNTMDVAHINHPFISGSLALRYCRPFGIPILFTNHTRYDLYAKAYLPALPDTVGSAAMQAYLPSFCRACDLVIAPSQGISHVLRRFGVDAEIEIVPNGVDLSPFEAAIQPIPRSNFGIANEDVVLIYAGRLGPEKNLPFLLRAFAGLAQTYENTHLIVLGEGPERDNLMDRVKLMGISHRVHFTGLVPYEQVARYLIMADSFVTASVTEVHPLSVIEAMAAGLPVLGIQSPGVGDTIQDGETGFITSEEDLASFTAKMVRMVVDRECRQKMGVQARHAAQNYSIQRTSRLLLECYQKAIQKSSVRKRTLRFRVTRFLDNLFLK